MFSPICSSMTRFSGTSPFTRVNSLNSSKASKFCCGSLPVEDGWVSREMDVATCLQGASGTKTGAGHQVFPRGLGRAGGEAEWRAVSELGWHLSHPSTLATKHLPGEACYISPLTSKAPGLTRLRSRHLCSCVINPAQHREIPQSITNDIYGQEPCLPLSWMVPARLASHDSGSSARQFLPASSTVACP